MRYMLLAYSAETAWTQEEWSACVAESTAILAALRSRGACVMAAPLRPVATAASVRVRQGAAVVTAGPFAETTEQLGGFFLVDVPDLDQAIAIAGQLPSARKGVVEVRPVLGMEGLPGERIDDPPAAGGREESYMLLCYDDAQAWRELGPAALHAAQGDAVALARSIDARGQYISAAPLHPVSTATCVRIREGRMLLTDGPFAETREFLGGYYLIRARDLNDALAVAVRHPGAPLGAVEVRRLVDLPAPSTTPGRA